MHALHVVVQSGGLLGQHHRGRTRQPTLAAAITYANCLRWHSNPARLAVGTYGLKQGAFI